MPARILVVDDEERICSLLVRSLYDHGIAAEGVNHPLRGLERLKEDPFDIVITDLRMPAIDGLEFLRRAKSIRPECEVVLMTGYATVATAREALKRGAVDYITKPFDVDKDMLPVLLDVLRASNDDDAPAAGPKTRNSEESEVVGSSRAMREVLARAKKAARSNAPILLCGESGTGKEVVANFIHRISSRAKRPMVRVNCAALPETLIESELFGFARGSFTGASHDRTGLFQAADGGTIFLDEIGEVPSALQPKLLRVLQDGTFHRLGDPGRAVSVDVRVIAATNRDLGEAAEAGTFRSDLYYRLAVIPIEIPPLRERIEALPDLIEHLMGRLGAPRGLRFSDAAMEAMHRYPWPGNVRELANAIEYAAVLGELPEIGVEGLPVAIQDHERRLHLGAPPEAIGAETLEDIEMRCIVQAMERTGFNRTRAAHLLGITRRTLGYRINKYGLAERLDEMQADLAASGRIPVRKVRGRSALSQSARA